MLCLSPATLCPSLSNLEGEETFEATTLGQAEEVVQERLCDDELILIKKYVAPLRKRLVFSLSCTCSA